MAGSLKDRISRALDEASARARELAKSVSLKPAQPRLAPIPVPARPRK